MRIEAVACHPTDQLAERSRRMNMDFLRKMADEALVQHGFVGHSIGQHRFGEHAIQGELEPVTQQHMRIKRSEAIHPHAPWSSCEASVSNPSTSPGGASRTERNPLPPH